MLIPKPLVEEPTIPALSAALRGRFPFLAILRAAVDNQKGITQHWRWGAAAEPRCCVPITHAHHHCLACFQWKYGLTFTLKKKKFLARTPTCTCWRTSPRRPASPHTLQSAHASPAQPMQNNSKGFLGFLFVWGFFVIFSCRLESCSAHSCTGTDCPKTAELCIWAASSPTGEGLQLMELSKQLFLWKW